MIEMYFQRIHELLQTVVTAERHFLELAAEKLATTIKQGGIIHLFGCGHSHLLAEELYYRAGGLAPIHPILPDELMLHKGALRSSRLERTYGYAQTFMKNEDIRKHDSIIVISTSGRNPVPIDVALIAKEKGAYTIGMSSTVYTGEQTSRHPSGEFLKDVVDLHIDNHVPMGDAILQHELVSVPFAPTSTVVGATILNSIIGKVISNLAEEGLEPPIFLSGNIDGADGHNRNLVEKYNKRLQF